MRRALILWALTVWFLFVSVAPALGETSSGLNVTVYSYDPSATPERQPYVLCSEAWTHVDNIDADYDNQYEGVVAGCQTDFVLVHYTGFVTFPDSGVYSFMAPADDGFYLSLDNNTIIDDWFLKGRYGNVYDNITIEGGHTYALDAWFYEYGGGASATLQFKKSDSEYWVTVPAAYFTTDGTAPVVEPPIVKRSLNAPVNVVGVADGTNVDLFWEFVEGNTALEHYAVTWTYDGADGWGISALTSPVTIGGLPEDTDVVFKVRADNDSLAVYSDFSEPVVVHTGFDPIVNPPVDPPVDPEPPVDPPVVPETPPAPDSGDNNPPVIDNPQAPVEPVVDPPVTEPTDTPKTDKPTEDITEVDPSTIDPQTLTDEDVVALVAVAYATLETAEPDSAEYQQALEQLFVAAQADDIVVDEQLASVPVLGSAVVAVTDAINYLGNVGADMSPKARETAKKEVIAAVVVTQVATQAAAMASMASVSSIRRTN